jgi:hypothetical protein
MFLSFRSREYFKETDNWDQTGVDVAFWNGHQKSDLLIRSLIISMILFDFFIISRNLLNQFTINRFSILIVISFLLFFTLPYKKNLTILHLEYKRMDIFSYKVLPFLKPLQISEKSVFMKDFQSATLSKINLRFTPYWQIKLRFNDPKTIIKIPIKGNLPYHVHSHVYYNFKKKCSADVDASIAVLEKFYPYFELKKSFNFIDFRYLFLLTYFLTYLIFSLIISVIIN